MPFTFAHPAIVLPLKQFGRHWFSLTGLVLGSLAPDFEYFMRLVARSTISHTMYGVFLFDLPLTFLLSLLFHYVLRNPIIDHLPTALYQRTANYRSFKWIQYLQKNLLIFIISAVIGSLSHIFWDAFTHKNGYFVMLWPNLGTYLFTVYGYQVYIYKVLQHGSTLIGFFILSRYFFLLPKVTERRKKLKEFLPFWSKCATISALLVISKLVFLGTGDSILSGFIVTFISCNMLALILVSLSKLSIGR